MDTPPGFHSPHHVRQLRDALPLKLAKDSERLLRLAEVEARCGIKKSRIYAGMADGTFPKCVRLPGGRAVAWPASRIDSWIAAVIAGGDLATQGGAQ